MLSCGIKKSILIFLLLFHTILFAQHTSASGKIKVYFTRSVNTSYSSGTNAVELYRSMDDTLAAYINRAHKTLDIAIYNYTHSSTIADIAQAINNAHARGVKVRVIYNGSTSNTGTARITSQVHKLASPQGSNYNIMHHKFVVIDAKSDDDAIVWTGSTNWSSNQFYNDANNTVIIQDKALALAYTKEFEEMWGDTSAVPNTTNSRFGKFKTDNTPHQFIIDGKLVELYFSPSDNTNGAIHQSIQSADEDLCFSVFQFTRNDFAQSIKQKVVDGVVAKGIVDPGSMLAGKAAFDTMALVMYGNLLLEKQSGSSFHHKYFIADQSTPYSSPLVLTGSHNWTTAAQTLNDENTLIIHDATIANVYYQEFMARFEENMALSIPVLQEIDSIAVYPNPFYDVTQLQLPPQTKIIEVFSLTGQQMKTIQVAGGERVIELNMLDAPKGIYFLKTVCAQGVFVQRLIKAN